MEGPTSAFSVDDLGQTLSVAKVISSRLFVKLNMTIGVKLL